MLKALELVGFKSFADRTRFEFPPGITVVVGPNGSGKSNIVDGIKWVLGEQSAKSLRGKDMADVIFKGSGTGESARKPINSAEATLVLDNSDHRFDIETDEVHVTRRVYRSGEGEYLINGEPCRLKDIRDLFRGTGVGTDAYSLIEQGKVDQMLQSSAKDRRAIFEEAAGISRFKAKKIETQRRLARVEQNLLRLSDIVEEVDRRYRSIKAQASKATRYQEWSDRLKRLRTYLGWLDWNRFAERLAEIEANCAELDERLAVCSKHVAELEATQSANETEVTSLAEKLGACESHLSDHRERIATRESSLSLLRVRVDDIAGEEIRLNRSQFAQRKQLSELTERLKKAEQETETAELDYREEADRVESLEAEVLQIEQSLIDFEQREEERRQAVRSYTQKVSELETQVSAEASRLEELRRGHDRLEEQVQHLTLDESEVGEQWSEIRQQQQQLEAEAEAKDTALATAKRTVEQTRGKLEEQQSELTELRNERTGASRRAEVIEELEQKLEGVHAGVRQLLGRTRTGRTELSSDSGDEGQVIGLVADLIQVDVQHAMLIDVALGDVAQHVVVSGNGLVQELTEGKLQLNGRVGLIRMEEVSRPGDRDTGNLAGLPGVVGPIAEMIQTTSAYEPLVKHLLGQTWVVKTLDDAFRLRREHSRRVRFVTLDGQKVEPNGTIMAGPRTVSGGLVSRRSELRSLKAQLERLDRDIESRHLALTETQAELEGNERDVQLMMAEHSEISATLSDHRIMASSLQQKHETLTKQLHDAENELVELTKRIEEISASWEKNQTELKQLRVSLDELEAERDTARSQVVEDQQRKSKLDQQLTSAKIKLAKAEQALDLLQDRLQKDRSEIEMRRNESQSITVQQEVSKARRKETELSILATTGELAKLYLDRQELAAMARVVSAQVKAIQTQRQTLIANLDSGRDELKTVERKRHQLDLEQGKLDLERTSIMERLRDDYGLEIDQLELDPAELDEMPREEMEEEVQTLKRKINAMGAVNLEALNELSDLEARYGALNEQYHDLSQAKDSLVRIIDRINADSRKLFAETLEAIRQNFQVLYRRSFGGGKADLVLEEGVDILEAGIDIIATPPGKPEFNNSLLSGGEKALTAVALLMAIFQYRPSPFCVLDEVDAPFDEANIGRFIDTLHGFLDRTRFVIVTHSKKTMTAATTLYGVTMQESGVSKRVSVKFEDVSEDGHIDDAAVEREASAEEDAA